MSNTTETRSSDVRQQPRGVNRRTVVKGFAWSVPAIAAATSAPLVAASPLDACRSGGQVNWGTYAGTSPTRVNFGTSGVSAALTYRKSHTDLDLRNTGQVSSSLGGLQLTIGGRTSNRDPSDPSRNFIKAGEWVSLTMSFSTPVTGLTIRINDIDSYLDSFWGRSWWDQIYFSQQPTLTSRGSRLQGLGTSASPLQPKAWATTNPADVPEDRAIVTWPGCLSSITITFRAGYDSEVSTSEFVTIGGLSFESCVASC